MEPGAEGKREGKNKSRGGFCVGASQPWLRDLGDPISRPWLPVSRAGRSRGWLGGGSLIPPRALPRCLQLPEAAKWLLELVWGFFFLRREERKFSLSPAPSLGAFNRSPVCHIPKKSKRCGMLSDSFWRNWR